jgi:hypothetical protein
MKSITLHNLDDNLVELIERESKDKGISLNKTIKNLLHKALGTQPKDKAVRKEEFSDLFGVWDINQFNEFEKNTKEFEQIDPEDWK